MNKRVPSFARKGNRSQFLNHITKLQFAPPGSILQAMSEMDEIWSRMLTEARENARVAARHDVADYLDLKASNDLIRRAGVAWLFETIFEMVASQNRTNVAAAIERTEPHSFIYRGANIVGSAVSFRYGVRCLTVEAGWTRTPADGFMRGGGLALARLRHFGIPARSAEIALTGTDGPPVWRVIGDDALREEVHSEYLRSHVDLLLSD